MHTDVADFFLKQIYTIYMTLNQTKSALPHTGFPQMLDWTEIVKRFYRQASHKRPLNTWTLQDVNSSGKTNLTCNKQLLRTCLFIHLMSDWALVTKPQNIRMGINQTPNFNHHVAALITPTLDRLSVCLCAEGSTSSILICCILTPCGGGT